MNTISRPTLLACVFASLTACGGSDDPVASPPVFQTLNGLAATGAAIANADVSARCVTGDVLTGKTGTDGVFNLTLSATHTAPCMLEVVNGNSKLYSFATEAGRVNITPVTDLVVANALKGNPADGFAGFGKESAEGIRAGLGAAKAYVKAQLKALTGSDYASDPIVDALVVGNADDKVLDALGKALGDAGKSITDLREGARTGASLATLLAKEPGTGGGGGACTTSSTTLPYAASTAGGPFSNGEQVCFSASTTELSISGVKLTNPTKNTAVSAPYSAYKFVGSSATFEVIFKDTALHEINVSSVDGSTFFGQIAADSSNAGTTPPPASASFFGPNKTAADIAFLNGQSFTGTNCSVSFANGTMTVTDTANNRTASAAFSGDAFDRIVPANGRAQIDFEFGDDLQVVNGRTYPATGKSSAQGRFQIADYVNTQATVLEAYVNQHDGTGKTVGAVCRNLNKNMTSWVRPTLSAGSLNLLETYSTDINRQVALATDVPKLVGTYTGLATGGAYQKVQLKPSVSNLANLTGQTCSLTVDAQGLATLAVADKTRADSLVGEWLLFHGGSMLTIASAVSASDTEYVKGYQFGQSGADLYITWADAAQYQGPVSAEFKATAGDNSSREQFSCQFK